MCALFLSVAAGPLSPTSGTEQNKEVAVDSEAQDSLAISSRVPSGAIAAILAAANAEPKAIDRSPGYGKRSTDSKEITVNSREPKALFSSELTDSAVDSEAQGSVAISSRVPSGAIAAILAAANAEPKAIDRSPGYGKRSTDSKDETKLGLVPDVPLDAVKVKIHSSHGNIAQHYDGDIEYQNAVLGGRFGRGKRESDNFIPFSVYDDRRVKTLKLEQNDFLALPERLQSQEKKKRHFTQN
jgi:hypothetical protein